MRIRDILEHLETLAPLSYAASWDNCGLQFGDPDRPCTGVLVTVNPSLASVEAAERAGANLVVAHHPLLFKATKRLDTRKDPGRTVEAMAKAGITCYAAHTNLDATACNHHLATLFGLPMDRILQVEGTEAWYKLIAWVPTDAAPELLDALWAAGAGRIGPYDQCSFKSEGEGTFRPLDGANPAVGSVGEHHQGPETRLEVLVPARVRGAVLRALHRVHPYEVPAYDVIRLENGGDPYGIGLWGELEAPMTIEAIAERVQAALKPRSLRLVGDRDRLVRRIGVCSGAGGDLYPAALAQGVELFITGEVRYHAALEAEAQGLALLEAGHQATEQPVVDFVVDYLKARVPESVSITGFAEPEPFEVLT
ncbi:Nif3-like dinuclear metal center hexameric protein [bacterium]|nr:Nif3-like dinuclear metal center hexameric protein [bacterium]